MYSKLNEIIEFICECKTELTDATLLSTDLDFDSMKFIQLVVSIENEYGFEFDEDELDLERIDKVENIKKIIESHIML